MRVSNNDDLQVSVSSPTIEGKITPGHKGNIIHSKLYTSDEYTIWFHYFEN